MELMATTDYLTGLLNRRKMYKKLNEEKNRFERNKREFSVIIADIDYFKKFNDTYGHECGDFVLVQISNLIKSTLRKPDIVCRWGGEEFLLLLPETNSSQATNVIERVRKSISDKNFSYNDMELSVTLTFGICTFDQNMNIDECIASADHALYIGKKQGRNCVVPIEACIPQKSDSNITTAL